jgi:hypothetical protein
MPSFPAFVGKEEGHNMTEYDVRGFSGENWTPTGDIRTGTRILSEILAGASAKQGWGSSEIPLFQSN